MARRRRVALAIRDQLAGAGVELRLVLGDTAEMDEESRVWMESIQDAASETELIRIRRRTSAGRANRARQGLPVRPPRFYRALRDERGKSVGYELLNGWRPFLDELARLYLAGLPMDGIALRLGANPATGRPWRGSSIQKIVSNPVLRGRLEWGRRIGRVQFTVPARLPPAWDSDTCAAIERELARRRAEGRARVRRGKALLSGVLRCGYCGHLMTGKLSHPSPRHKSHYWQYGCNYNTYRRRGLAPGPAHPPNWMHETKAVRLIRELLASVDPTEHLEALRAGWGAEQARASDYAERELARVEAELAALESERPTSSAGRAAIATEIQRLTEQVRVHRADIEASRRIEPPKFEAVVAALDRLRATGPDIDRDLLRQAFPGGIYVRGGEIVRPVPLQ